LSTGIKILPAFALEILSGGKGGFVARRHPKFALHSAYLKQSEGEQGIKILPAFAQAILFRGKAGFVAQQCLKF
jgi:hypothetical protein